MVVKRKIREKRAHDVLTSFWRFSTNGGGGGVNTDSGPYLLGYTRRPFSGNACVRGILNFF